MSTISLFCDGLCEPRNPGGYACWAWLAKQPNGKTIKTAYGCFGRGPGMTAPLAEYHAVLNAMRYTVTRLDLLRERGLAVQVYSDSQLIIRQITGAYACNKLELATLRNEIYQIVDQASTMGVPISFEWIPREQNEEADALSGQAYQEARLTLRRVAQEAI